MSVFNPNFSRRSFLQGLGAASLSQMLPLLNASGMEATTPKRLIIFWTPHGTVWDQWTPGGSGTNYTMSNILSPLAAYKNIVTPINGLSFDQGGHDSLGVLLTGDLFRPTKGWANRPSIDQLIANSISSTTPFRSIQAGVNVGGIDTATRLNFAVAGTPLGIYGDPNSLYNALYASTNALRSSAHSSMLQNAAVRLAALKPKIPSADRPKVEAHLSNIATIEKRLSSTCQAGAGFAHDASGSALDVAFRQELDMIAAAIACDLTRVVTLQYGFGDNDCTVYSYLSDPTYFPNGLTSCHHEFSHMDYSVNAAGVPNDPAAHAGLTLIKKFYAQQIAYLFDKLKAIPEGNGTALDNTLLLWCTEIGQGNHSCQPVPFVLAGGAFGALKMGQYVNLTPGKAPVAFAPNTQHNRLLITILQAFGLNYDSYGSNDNGSGPIPGLLV